VKKVKDAIHAFVRKEITEDELRLESEWQQLQDDLIQYEGLINDPAFEHSQEDVKKSITNIKKRMEEIKNVRQQNT
jgi:hypothetical protein